MGLAAGLAGAGLFHPRKAWAADEIRLWLQAQWWSDEFAASCMKKVRRDRSEHPHQEQLHDAEAA